MGLIGYGNSEKRPFPSVAAVLNSLYKTAIRLGLGCPYDSKLTLETGNGLESDAGIDPLLFLSIQKEAITQVPKGRSRVNCRGSESRRRFRAD